jgi:biopolymer transport protein TolR
MAMSGGSLGEVKAEPNVTPMIDVMLVLLIIFMLIIPQLDAGMSADPPKGMNLKPHPEEDTDQMLGIDKSGQYFLNKKPIPNETLQTALTAIFGQEREEYILYVKADKDLAYEKVLAALDIAAKSHVAKAALISDQNPGTMSSISTDNLNLGQEAAGAEKK